MGCRTAESVSRTDAFDHRDRNTGLLPSYTIQYNTLLTTRHGGFSVTMHLREVTIVSKKNKVDSKTLSYVYVIRIK